MEQLLAFASFAFVASVTPGLNNILMTTAGSQVGVLRGLPGLFGIAAGFALMIFVLSLGRGGVILENPLAASSVRWVGIAMLLWPAYRIATAPVSAENPKMDEASSTSRRPIGFVGAFLF